MRLLEKTPRFAQSFFDLTAACVRLADCHDCFAILAYPVPGSHFISIDFLHIRKAVHFEEFFLVGFGADEHDFFEAAVSFVNKTRDLFAGADAAADDRPQVFAVKINYFFFGESSKR